MPDIIVKILGFLAGICTTIAFVPQVLQVYHTRNTKDLSLGMFLVMSSGVALWLAYGILQRDWAVIVANAVTLPLSLYIVVMKIKYK